eukprot:3216251-Alexandrium_andersonii.AAC.1
MSASLVGSEMCIRDRREAAPAEERVQLHRPSHPVPTRPARRPPRRQESTCLLYTSDAADDM